MDSQHIAKFLGFLFTVAVGYGGYAQFEKHQSGLDPDQSLSSTSIHQGEADPDQRSPTAIAAILNESDPAKRYLSLRRYREDMHPDEISGILDSIRLREDRALQCLKINLLTLWAESDPAGALAWAGKTGRIGFDPSFEAIITGWAKRDLASVLQWAKDLPQAGRSSCLGSIIGAIAETNISEALHLLETDPALKSMPVFSTVNAIFGNATRVDPRKAIEEALLLPPGEHRTEAIKSIASTWVVTDPKAALSWIRELPPGKLRDDGMRNAIYQLASDDPESAIRMALKEIPSGSVQDRAVSEALEHWATRDLAAARTWVEKLPSMQDRETYISTIVFRELMRDPRAAMEYAMTVGWMKDRETLIQRTILQWISINPQAGVQWIEANRPSLDPSYLSDIATIISDRTPANAVHLIPFISKESSKAETYSSVARSWARVDVRASEKWLNQMPDGPNKDAFCEGFIQGIADFDLSRATSKVTGFPEGQLKTNSVSHVATVWAIFDAPSALSWVSETISGSNREAIVGEIVSRWARLDIDSTSNWLNTLAPGSLRDTAIKNFSSSIASKDPRSSAIWATNIGEETVRREALGSVLDQWIEDDEPAAKAWVQSASVPSDWKEGWLKK